MAFYLNVSYLLTYLTIIYHYIPSRVSREQMKAHPWTSCSVLAAKAARTVPCCCCAWGHFECGGAGGALPLCGVKSWLGPSRGPPPLHYSPLLLAPSVH